ncbi:spore germination protein KA [Desulfofundulus australicus DSM 11792]|uniref:Spore germination protein KA n=1 Tax=Desulfofundulus australicus DSM 11792 TaxID=1121425 RepID=A0A1M4X053_9FIRM|nr:spore germination protein [Desulfofundulus australicus]SHE86888.1 spore germination protein KA [Desulfofundulus australicus DSM 11792]
MFRFWKKRTRILPREKGNPAPSREDYAQWERSYEADELKKMPLGPRLKDNLALIKRILGNSSDLVIREFRLGVDGGVPGAVVFIDGLTDKGTVNDTLLKGLTLESRMAGLGGRDAGNIFALVRNFMVNTSSVREAATVFELLDGILYGDAAVLVEGETRALLATAPGWPVRSIEEPTSENLVRGPREGFTELLRTNTSLIRRRLRTPNLVLERITLGERTRTYVEVVYIRGLADPRLVQEVKSRLSRIRVDGILESGNIEELIEDNPYSPFPQVFRTERPDRVVSMLLDGRVAIVTDGTPFVLVVPAEFIVFLQSSEDYYERFFLAIAVRWLRYIAFVASLILPSLYISLTTFHQEMIPTRLLISIAASREGVPFPAFVEAFLMEFTFEALREAGIRLPRNVGQAVSIVGALVIGQAAVSAGIVSSLMVIIVALTGISSFVAPVFSMAITMRLLRFPMMVLAATLGIFGVMMGLLVILVHMASLRSFGIPYLAPLAPLHTGDLKDLLMRVPLWAMDKRPSELAKGDPLRQEEGLKPAPPDKKGGQG